MTPPSDIQIPRLAALARHAVPRVVECTLVPVAIFVAMLRVVGVRGAILGGFAWSLGAIATRLVLGRRVPGLLVIGTVTLAARTALALATGSTFLYFLQPSLATACLAVVFLASAIARRPLAAVLAHDFCPLPPDFVTHDHVRRVFMQITLLWAAAQMFSAAVTVWLLLSQSTATFVLARTALSFTLTPLAIAASTALFVRGMRRQGIRVSFAPRRAAVVSSP